MESPKFIICPECNQRYNDTNKRRLIDTCGHPRCYSCLFKDKPCPVCTKLPHRLERARTLSNEKILDNINGESKGLRQQRFFSDTFNGAFRKDSYLRTLYSYDPGSKDYNMEEKIRKYKSLEGLNFRTRDGSTSSDLSSEVFIFSHENSDQQSVSSSTDELDDKRLKYPSRPGSPEKCHRKGEHGPKAWPSCPELTVQENIWQMKPNVERRKRPTSLYHVKCSNSSPRNSTYSPRSSGYWSELEQLSESESFCNSPIKHHSESPLSKTTNNTSEHVKATITITSPTSEETVKPTYPGKLPGLQKTKDVLQQWRFKPNRTRSTESLRSDGNNSKTFQRINSMPVECHTKKVSENNVRRKAHMTDV